MCAWSACLTAPTTSSRPSPPTSASRIFSCSPALPGSQTATPCSSTYGLVPPTPCSATCRPSSTIAAALVAVEYLDANLGEEATPASKHFLVQRDIPPVWEVVEARIRSDAVYAPSFYILLAIAGLIGAVGILTNSQILIVGAMVVGPEYNAIIGSALGIDKRARRPIIRGLLALLAGFSAAMIVTLLFALAIRWSGHTPKLYSLGVRPVSSLIDSPNLFSIVVAVLAGIVGVVSLTEARASALIGVFISVTTIPAAADLGLSIGYGSWSEARGSAFQLLLNVVVLIAVGALVLRVQRIIWGARERAEPPRNAPGAGPPAVTRPG